MFGLERGAIEGVGEADQCPLSVGWYGVPELQKRRAKPVFPLREPDVHERHFTVGRKVLVLRQASKWGVYDGDPKRVLACLFGWG